MDQAHGLIARDAELAELVRAVESTRHARAVRLCGRSGMGKTSMLGAASQTLRERGWLVLATGCDLIEREMPLAALPRMMDAVKTVLGESADIYTTGLSPADSAGALEERWYRLLEGLLVDFPILLVVDDAQWLDSETERVLAGSLRLFATRRLAVLGAERGQRAQRFAGLPVRDLRLDAMSDEAVAAIVQASYPEAPDAVVAAIVARATGHPMTAAVLAREARDVRAISAEQVPASLLAALARTIEAMQPRERELLQLCSLIEEPIEFRILEKLYAGSAEPFVPAVESLAPALLAVDGRALRFRHAAFAEAIRHALPADASLRERVFRAQESLGNATLEDYERTARLAYICDEPGVARDTLLALARAATGKMAWAAAAGAYKRAFAIAEPADATFARDYTLYARVLIANDDPLNARRVLAFAVEAASKLELAGGFGELVAMYMTAMWYDEDLADIPRVFERCIPRAVTAGDRAAMYSTIAFYRATTLDVAGFAAAKRHVHEFAALSANPAWIMRAHQSEAFLEARLGNAVAARAALAAASKFVAPKDRVGRIILGFTGLIADFLERGTEPVVAYASDDRWASEDEYQINYMRYLRGFVTIARGALGDASLLVEQSLMRRIDQLNRKRVLSLAACVTALTGLESPHAWMIEDAAKALEEDASESILPLAAWWAASIAHDRTAEARAAARTVLSRVRQPLQPTTLFVPFALVLCAERARDVELLEELADRLESNDASRWWRAHQQLAQGVARAALGRTEAPRELSACAAELDALGAPLFAAIAAEAAGTATGERLELLRTAGVGEPADVKRRPTPRESQIAALAEGGFSNHEIAGDLALSARTVEAYLDSLSSKLGGSERA